MGDDDAQVGVSLSSVLGPSSFVPLALLPLAALVSISFLLSYPWGWAAQNLARGWAAQRADLAWARGDHAGALALDTEAIHAQETPDGWLRLGDHARAAGEVTQALQAYRAAVALQADYPPAVAHLGDVLRATGDPPGARRMFQPEDIGQQELTDWSWRVLTPVFTNTLVIGDGLDFGYVAGMYPAEVLQGVPARWTDGRGLIRFGTPPAGSPPVALLRLRLAAPRPDGAPVTAQVCAAGACQSLVLGAAWQVYLVPIALDPTAPTLMELRSLTFAAGGRQLGVQISAAGLVGAQ